MPLSQFGLGSHELEAELSRVVMRVYQFLQEVREEERHKREEELRLELLEQTRVEEEKLANQKRLRKFEKAKLVGEAERLQRIRDAQHEMELLEKQRLDEERQANEKRINRWRAQRNQSKSKENELFQPKVLQGGLVIFLGGCCLW